MSRLDSPTELRTNKKFKWSNNLTCLAFLPELTKVVKITDFINSNLQGVNSFILN